MIFRGGCIIRAGFLQNIKDAYDRDAALPNLLLDSYFKEWLNRTKALGVKLSLLQLHKVFQFQHSPARCLTTTAIERNVCRLTCCKLSVITLVLTHSNAWTKKARSTLTGCNLKLLCLLKCEDRIELPAGSCGAGQALDLDPLRCLIRIIEASAKH